MFCLCVCERTLVGGGTVWVGGVEPVCECPVCGRVAPRFDVRSAWCARCVEVTLADQERELADCRQDREVVGDVVLRLVDG